MAWAVRADCTYTTAARKDIAYADAVAVLAAHPHQDVAGKYDPGIADMSPTRFTVSVNCDTYDQAAALMGSLRDALTSQTRSQTFFSYFDLGD